MRVDKNIAATSWQKNRQSGKFTLIPAGFKTVQHFLGYSIVPLPIHNTSLFLHLSRKKGQKKARICPYRNYMTKH